MIMKLSTYKVWLISGLFVIGGVLVLIVFLLNRSGLRPIIGIWSCGLTAMGSSRGL